jgi:CheY-like chemotaxis protein
MPIISISGDTSEAAAAECLSAGMNGRINKPFKPDDIYKMIEINMKQLPG